MTYAVETYQLTKQYDTCTALDQMDLRLEENKIYGLLGRNGAGKTTLLNLLAAQNLPTAGGLRIFGENPWDNSRVLQRMCYVRENAVYPYSFRVREILRIAADFFPNWSEEVARELLNAFELNAEKKNIQLSRGMRTALGVIIGIASRAPLTIFDEPALGLDAVARQILYDRLLQDFGECPRTILLSTHLIDEVSMLFENVIIMNRGRQILHEEAERLRNRGYYLSGKKETVAEFARGREILHEQQLGGQSEVAVYNELKAEDRAKAAAMGIDIHAIPLQKLFVYLTEREKRCHQNESD